ncbi:MAG: hypothetical protein P9M00_02605 [Candidatus Tritonobacter lacicola]|nr:hypothetical protein [Candidatus Tritonobacter lacicola]
MKKILITLAVIFLASCAPRTPVPPETPEPATPFSGTWREMRNQNKPVRDKTWTFEGNTITIIEGENTYTGTFTYNEDAEPGEINISFEGYPPNKAIYEIRGNTLMLKLLDTATTRSKKLRPERGYILIMCHREKDE